MDNSYHHHHHHHDERKVVHVLVLLCPTQGHINPLVQFAKRLTSKGLKATIATTHYTLTSIDAPGIMVEHISDGFDETGFVQSSSAKAYMEQFEKAGSESLSQLIRKFENTRFPLSCIVYDSFLPWGLDVAKEHGLLGATFFTTSAAVYSTYFHFHRGLLKLPPAMLHQEPAAATLVSLPGFPLMGLCDLPSFLTSSAGSNSDYFGLVMNQFSNLEMADWVFGNTFELLEEEVVKAAKSSLCPIMTIGPMVPSTYLDGRIEGDKGYGANLWEPIGDECLNWLGTKPCKSVVYVSFGSRIELTKEQIEEIALGLKGTGKNFLWVLKECEKSKLPDGFMDSTKECGLLVPWCVQLEVLAHQATGCFITHCGWNSTLEGLSLGVPMVAVPQWTDQPTNAKFVQEVWGVGVRAKVDEKGVVSREELQCCIRKLLVGERKHEIEWNAGKWKKMAKEAISEGGSSDKNLDKFVGHLLRGKEER